MKKIITILIVILLVASLVGCGNRSVGFGKFTFKKIHVDTHHYSGCLTVEKWYENEGGIEVKTSEVGHIYLADGMYVLIESECPFCS